MVHYYCVTLLEPHWNNSNIRYSSTQCLKFNRKINDSPFQPTVNKILIIYYKMSIAVSIIDNRNIKAKGTLTLYVGFSINSEVFFLVHLNQWWFWPYRYSSGCYSKVLHVETSLPHFVAGQCFNACDVCHVFWHFHFCVEWKCSKHLLPLSLFIAVVCFLSPACVHNSNLHHRETPLLEDTWHAVWYFSNSVGCCKHKWLQKEKEKILLL